MRNRPKKFTVLAAGQHYKIRYTEAGERVHYRACLIQYRDGRRVNAYVRDELAVAA